MILTPLDANLVCKNRAWTRLLAKERIMTWVAISFVVSLVIWSGVMLYAWAAAYPMFRDVGEQEFIAVHRTYERGLPLGVYAPFGLMAATVGATVFLGPADVPPLARWLAVGALLGGVVTTALCAAPMHVQLIRRGKDARRIEIMLACNAARAAFAFVGLAAAIWVLAAL